MPNVIDYFGSSFGCAACMVLVALFVPSSAFGQNKPSIHFGIYADPSGDAKEVSLSLPFTEEQIANKFPASDVSVDLENVDQPNSFLSLSWTDGSTSQFPIQLVSAFANKKVDVFFIKEPSDADSISKCVPSTAVSLQSLFQMFFYCRKAANVAEKQVGQWTQADLSALNGWLIANYALYTRSKPVSPYGFDRDLLAKLQAMVDQVDQHKYSDTDFLPVRLADARAALKLVNEENVRLAGFVPEFIRNGDLTAAAVVNSVAEKGLNEILGGPNSHNIVVQGVTPAVLENNKIYITTLRGITF